MRWLVVHALGQRREHELIKLGEKSDLPEQHHPAGRARVVPEPRDDPAPARVNKVLARVEATRVDHLWITERRPASSLVWLGRS